MDQNHEMQVQARTETRKDADSDLHVSTLKLFGRPVSIGRNAHPAAAREEAIEKFTDALLKLTEGEA